MSVKTYKPTSAGRRNMSTLVNDEITKKTPDCFFHQFYNL